MPKKVLGFVGSLRKKSYNKMLLRAAQKLAPEEMEIEISDLAPSPMFNQDDKLSLPASVAQFKQKIREADGILVTTPEYSYSIPGVLKNAMDWASRPQGNNSFTDKPVAIMRATLCMLGSSQAQYHLRQIFVFLNMHQLNRPEIMTPLVSDKFNTEDELINEETKEKRKGFLEASLIWIKRFQ